MAVRKDALPEAIKWVDVGRRIAPACLECPLKYCVLDTNGVDEETRVEKWERDMKIVQLRKEGVPIPELQRAFKLSGRQIHRIIQTGSRPRPNTYLTEKIPQGAPAKKVDQLARELPAGFKGLKPY